MAPVPYPIGGEGAQTAYQVVPDNIRGGWNVYATHKPQEPQEHFPTKEKAIDFAERISLREGVGFTVSEHEAVEMGNPT
jgi:hypothetical protein